ncbi:MAG: transposase [SAR324 cluster bacterium]|nr:transposase [SAR324 cluster bacterium]
MKQVRLCNAQGRPRRDAWPDHGARLQQGYSYRRVRRWLCEHRIRAAIPERSDERRYQRGRPIPFDPIVYPRRSAVERCVGRLKEYRRIATRYDQFGASFPVRVDLARTRQTMNINLSDTAQALTRICWTFGIPAKNNAGALRGGQFSTSGQQSALCGFSRCNRRD